MKKLQNILLIDDNEADNNYHKTIIEEANITENITIVENGIDALEYLTNPGHQPPDLIFLDINMPKMNGWEFLEAYKAIDGERKTKVIVMLTTSQNPEDKRRAEQVKEVSGFEVKPISAESLAQIIKKYFSENKPEPRKTKVLLVEDNPADAGIVEDYLGRIYNDAFTLATCDYLDKAIALIKQEKFDLILLDLSLPDSTGLDTFSTLFAADPGCPIIILTGVNDESIGIKAVELGAQDFLIKNLVNIDNMRHSITHSVERYKLLKSLADNAKALEQRSADLYRKQQQFEQAQKMAHMGSWEWDIVTNDISWSDELYRIYGLRPLALSPKLESTMKYVHPEDKERVTKIVEKAYREKSAFSIDYRIVCADGSEQQVHEEGQPLKDAEGNTIKMYGTILNVTEQKKLEEITKEKELAEKLAKAKDQFLARMSHELRTPLTGIIGFTNLLLKSGLSGQERKQMEAVKVSSEILLVLINDILDISVIESGKLNLDEAELHLAEMIQMMVAGFAPKVTEKNIVVTTRFDEKIPEKLFGDPVRVEQIVLNLLNNAIKFTRDGEILVRTRLLEENNDTARVEITVSDTGIGIPDDKLETIFEAFNPASRDTASKYGGTGLGLNIVNRLVRLMQGTVTVQSKVKEGTTFTITLPLKKHSSKNAAPKTEALLDQKELKSVQHLRILLAEDSAVNQFLIETIMHNYGFDIDIASNGKIAVELLEKNDYDVILMDLMMPDMDGYDAARYIRKIKGPKSEIPILALTADVSKSCVQKCAAAGMNDYASKPFHEIELLNKILRMVKNPKEKRIAVDTNPAK